MLRNENSEFFPFLEHFSRDEMRSWILFGISRLLQIYGSLHETVNHLQIHKISFRIKSRKRRIWCFSLSLLQIPVIVAEIHSNCRVFFVFKDLMSVSRLWAGGGMKMQCCYQIKVLHAKYICLLKNRWHRNLKWFQMKLLTQVKIIIIMQARVCMSWHVA